MQPEGATLVITAGVSGTADLIVTDVNYSALYQPFDRVEYDNTRQREVKTVRGERRILIELLGGKPAQIITDCADTTAVPLIPNSTTIFNQVARRFNIVRYTIQGAISTAAEVNILFNVSAYHQLLLAQFDAHIKRASGDINYDDLITLQSQTFSYLTTTGVSASGTALESSVSNILITSVNVNNAFSIPNSVSANDFYKTFNITFETRSISALSA